MLETRVIDLDDVCFAFLTGHFSITVQSVESLFGFNSFNAESPKLPVNIIFKVAKFGYRYGDAAYIHESTVCVDEAH